jgi:hypothetical protein
MSNIASFSTSPTRSIRLPKPTAARWRAIVAGIVATSSYFFIVTPVAFHFAGVKGLIAALACLPVFFILLVRLDPSTAEVRRDGNKVLGARRGLVLTADQGSMEVREHRVTFNEGQPYSLYEVFHSSSTSKLGSFDDPLKARAFAEGLCRLGGYSFRWVSTSNVHTEERTAAELDVPLPERLRREPDLFGIPNQEDLRALRCSYDIRPDGSLLLHPAPSYRISTLAKWAVFCGAVLALAYPCLKWSEASPLRATVGACSIMALALAGLGLGTAILCALTGTVCQELAVSTDKIRGRWTVLGLGFYSWSAPATAFESLYVEGPSTLLLLGDSIRRRLALNHRSDVDPVCSLIGCALTGRRPNVTG